MNVFNKKNPLFNGAETLPVGANGYTEETDPDFAPAIVVAGWEFDHLTAPEVWDDYLRHVRNFSIFWTILFLILIDL